MKLVIAAMLVAALNFVSTESWAGYCSVSAINTTQKPVFAQVIKASEEDSKKKKKEGEASEDDEPDCD